MNLFISNFKSELKVLQFVAGCFLAAEIAVRVCLPLISSDWQNFRMIDRLASESSVDGKTRILMLGNSLTRYSIVPEELQRGLASEDKSPVQIQRVGTDDSNITEWFYLIRRRFSFGTAKPDVIVIGYAEDQLSDRAPVHVHRLGAFYGGISIAKDVFENDVHDFGSRMDFLLSSVSSLYANRDRIGTRLLHAAVPGYATEAQMLNRDMKNAAAGSRSTEVNRNERLIRLIDLCRAQAIGLIVVAMPIPFRYEVNAGVKELSARRGALFIDMRNTPGLNSGHFPDGYHLNGGGASIYTKNFATVLRSIPEFNALLWSKTFGARQE